MFPPEITIAKMIEAALAAADPATAVQAQLTREPLAGERFFIVSAGKAAAAMARAALAELGSRVVAGVAIGKMAPPADLALAYYQGSHPIPDERSIEATRAVRQMLAQTTAADHVLCLISGGASALLTDPLLPLAQWRAVNDALLRCGCTINEVNCVRQRLDRVKGGGLLDWITPAHCTTLILSDVIGDDIAHIGSGPTVVSALEGGLNARAIVETYGITRYLNSDTSAALIQRLAAEDEPPRRQAAANIIVGNNERSAQQAAAVAQAHGYRASVESTDLVGEARDVGRRLAAVGRNLDPGVCQVYGGETTVTIPAGSSGRGGRNQELALAAAIQLEGYSDVWLAALATDGEDGPTPVAGAIVNGLTTASAIRKGIDPVDALDRHDSYHFFATLGNGHIDTGSTGTNVNDLTILLKRPASAV